MTIPKGYCGCGCGERTGIASKTRLKYQEVRGDPVRFRRGHHARVISIEQRFWSKVSKAGDDECWEWSAGRFDDGYGAFLVDYQNRGAHRVAWELEHGAIPLGLIVCHRCDNPPCVNPNHLFLGTHADNSADMHSKGRAATPGPIRPLRGEEQVGSKLTADEVREIRLRAGTVPYRVLAEEFNVSESLVSLIVRGKRWKHLLRGRGRGWGSRRRS